MVCVRIVVVCCGDMIVYGIMFYFVGMFLGVLCSYDDGPLFACLEWE